MRKLLLLFITTFSISFIFGQTAYIQVSGESGLSVYLNDQFKGKTSDEFNGYIIENVRPGKNLIKVVKEGYTPFEETVTVKPGEVLAYKVKPFTKHIVEISQHGNSAETDKKAVVEMGKLIIQSVPIEIKITMPAIDGINNTAKLKDEWVADKIPAGGYTVSFTFNKKVITKTVEISGNETTSVFVNMISGDYKAKNSLDEKKAKEKEAARKHAIVYKYLNNLMNKYKFKVKIKEDDFRQYNPAAASIMTSRNWSESSSSYSEKNKHSNIGSIIFFDDDKKLVGYSYDIIYDRKSATEAKDFYDKAVAEMEQTIPKEFLRQLRDGRLELHYPKMNVQVSYRFTYDSYRKAYRTSIFFLVIDRKF